MKKERGGNFLIIRSATLAWSLASQSRQRQHDKKRGEEGDNFLTTTQENIKQLINNN